MPEQGWRWVVIALGTIGLFTAGAVDVRGASPPFAPAGTSFVETTAPPLAAEPGVPAAGTAPVSPLSPLAPPLPGATSAQVPGGPSSALPTLLPDEVPIKDLTPPGFADPCCDGHGHGEAHGGHGGHGGHGHHGPGHLNPLVSEEGGFFTNAEFLLLRPRRGAFDYVLPNTSGGLATIGAIRSLNYELRTGVRAEVGYRFGHTGWDVLFGYTYFRSNAFDSTFAGPGQTLLPTLTRPGLTENVIFAAAEANLEYNLYDLQFGRRFALDEHFAVRAFGGLRFASIRQDFKAYYDGLDATRAAVFAPHQFEGFGPLAGAEAVIVGWHGFHVYGRASGGALTGPSENPILETNGGGSVVYVDSAYNIRKVVPFAAVGFGGGWQYRNFSIRAGYEITHWFDLIDQPRFVDDVGQGKFVSRPANLSLEGLFVQMGLTF